MTRTLIIPLTLLALCLAGCETTSQERIVWLEQSIKTFQTEIAQDKQFISELEAQWVAARTEWADPNKSNPELQALAAKMKDIEAKVVAKTSAVKLKEINVEAYRAELAAAVEKGVNQGDEIALYGKGVTTVGGALPAPYNGIAIGIGTVLTAAGTALGSFMRGRKAKSDEKAIEEKADAKLQAEQEKRDTIVRGLVGSTDALLASNIVTDKAGAKQVLAYHQASNCPAAAQAVQDIRNNA